MPSWPRRAPIRLPGCYPANNISSRSTSRPLPHQAGTLGLAWAGTSNRWPTPSTPWRSTHLRLRSRTGWPTQKELSVAEMRMVRWICGHTRRDRVQNDDIRERLGVALVEEKLVQHRLKWFRHIQRRPAESSIRNGVIKRTGNEKRDRGRSNLTWEESVKRDLKDWCITKELVLDRKEWNLEIYMPEP
jgi:hypothetical protein